MVAGVGNGSISDMVSSPKADKSVGMLLNCRGRIPDGDGVEAKDSVYAEEEPSLKNKGILSVVDIVDCGLGGG